ncbi:hypothetical protein JHV675_53730 [Mycobacterium avium subsp. hominissuis]
MRTAIMRKAPPGGEMRRLEVPCYSTKSLFGSIASPPGGAFRMIAVRIHQSSA